MAALIKYNQQLLDGFFKFCKEKATGTFIIATESHSCHIVIEQGEVISASYGQEKGLYALQAFKNLQSGHFKFSNNYKLRMNENATIQNSTEALDFLGYNSYLEALTPPSVPVIKVSKASKDIEPTPPEEIIDPEPERKVIGMYRGKPIYEKIQVSNVSENTSDNKHGETVISQQEPPKKPVRIYRGKVIK